MAKEYAEINTAINFNLLISKNDQLCDVAKNEYDELSGLNENLELYASRSAFNLDEGSQNRIERNIAYELVRNFQENDSYIES
ncbi:hypothetical protein C1646_763081 [Rhizophagus diaphanus]|nr:hypothetical protein C1646_763081 [Rhizophagus diaphanus] [Rhizophagus sp. MUCL 43196]